MSQSQTLARHAREKKMRKAAKRKKAAYDDMILRGKNGAAQARAFAGSVARKRVNELRAARVAKRGERQQATADRHAARAEAARERQRQKDREAKDMKSKKAADDAAKDLEARRPKNEQVPKEIEGAPSQVVGRAQIRTTAENETLAANLAAAAEDVKDKFELAVFAGEQNWEMNFYGYFSTALSGYAIALIAVYSQGFVPFSKSTWEKKREDSKR